MSEPVSKPQTEAKQEAEKPKFLMIHLAIRQDLYVKLWDIVKKRFLVPTRKFSVVVNEALEEYVKRYYQEEEKS